MVGASEGGLRLRRPGGRAAAGAQSTLGVVLGTVKDPSGAVVSGAVVRLTNAGENTSRETVSSENGSTSSRRLAETSSFGLHLSGER